MGKLMAPIFNSTVVLVFVLGGLAGAMAAGWRGRRELARRLAEARAEQEARLREAALGGERLRQDLEALLPRVAESVLGSKTQQLEKAAASELKLLSADTVAQVGKTQAGMTEALQQMQQRLGEYQARITEFEKDRAQAQGRFEQQIASVAIHGAAMVNEARGLRQALATSGGVRGKWGEAVLKNLLESCGLNEQVDFHLQEREQGGQPDAVIHLPGGRELIVDAKANLSEFLAGLEAVDASERQACYARFAAVLRQEAKALSRRDYTGKNAESLPYVVMFVASEGGFRAALDADPQLFYFGQELRPQVVLASPSTLFPLIAVIAHGWQQHRASQGVQNLVKEIGELGDRLRVFVDHFGKIGKGINDSGAAYEAALRSFNSRLAPQLAKLDQMGAAWEDVKPLAAIEPRPLLADAARGHE